MRFTILLPFLLLTACAAEHGHSHEHGDHGPASRPATEPVDVRMERTAAIHGGAGPFAVAGYRIGERALRELGQARGAFALRVVHKSPESVQWSCVADGLQAATGTSPGKLNLRWEKVDEPTQTESLISVRGSAKVFRARLRPSFVKRYRDLPRDQLKVAGREVAELPEDEIFTGELEER